ncbi:transcriptional regulator, PadR family [Rubrobacter xylanophilus DSM 9941]|uniref:Transcriptional regulator, PadR family n=1 Tax=Rubrobacter xylanophilus (strain DSM 9941 / JCM 11954 / NBRC 16129 / PRD-1) TaxID=266117 RepID=Q1AYM9_RUBXD|nr:transcriptional regulator, PadR family [Rubrobacter xylanophilus DSM 9941]
MVRAPGGFFWRGSGFGPRRRFGKGDLKYVILDLLERGPAHGYQLIKALEERSRGLYAPSPGSVYPTLQMLEDMGYVGSSREDGKKVYQITEEGRGFLRERRRSLEEVWRRFGRGWDPGLEGELHEIRHELAHLWRLFGRKARAGRVDQEKLRRVRGVVVEAARRIEDILEDRDARA